MLAGRIRTVKVLIRPRARSHDNYRLVCKALLVYKLVKRRYYIRKNK